MWRRPARLEGGPAGAHRCKASGPVPWVGARTVKTALAVTAAMWITHELIGEDYSPFAGIAAVVAVQPTWQDSRQVTWVQIAASVLGAAWGIGAAALIGYHPLWVGVNVLLIFALGRALGLEKVAALSVTVTLLTMGQPDTADYALHRLAGTALGIGAGTLINVMLWRPSGFHTAEGDPVPPARGGPG